LFADPDGEGGMGMSIDYTKQGGGRRLFGGRRDEGPDPEVEERMSAAEERAQSAESRIGDLQAELAFYGDAVRSLKGELETMAERVVSRVAPQVVELEARAAETNAIRTAVDSLRADIEAERERLMQWRREAQAAISGLNADIDVAHRAIDAMPERIREALTPAAEAMSAVGARMVSLAAMPLPPPGVMDGRGPDSFPAETGSEYAESPGYDSYPAPVAPEQNPDGGSYAGIEDSYQRAENQPVDDLGMLTWE
jgi:hypothetical protein